MDLNNNNGEAQDRVSELPDSILHYILSFLEIKCVARTSILSKRWKFIWTSIPTLLFPSWKAWNAPSLSEINKFVDFVDRTLLLHDPSSIIQKFSLGTHKHMNASQVHSWISNITSRSVQEVELILNFDLDKPFFVPLSLFTCDSLIKLELYATGTTHLPKIFSFPKLKTLELNGIQFTDDNCWKEKHFSNCPVLEDMILEDCTWSDARDFCISIPALKVLRIYAMDDDGFHDCALKINAPNLVSLTYHSRVAKEYVLSSFESLESAEVLFCNCVVPSGQKIGYCAAASKFIRALSHVQNLEINAETLEALSIVDDFASILPVFHDLEELVLTEGITTDKSLVPLLKAMPNLTSLVFEKSCLDNNNKETEHSWAGHMLTAGCMFQHLESVTIVYFKWKARQMRWVELMLKNAQALEEIILRLGNYAAVNKEILMSELLCLPRASARCEFKLEK